MTASTSATTRSRSLNSTRTSRRQPPTSRPSSRPSRRRTRQAAAEAAESSAEKLSKAGKLFKGIDVATKVLPFALDALDLISQINHDAKEAEAKVQRRAQIEAQLEAIKSRAVAENYGAFQSECDGLSAVLDELRTTIDAVAKSLNERREFCDSARKEASALL